jgi:hypothetical protein
VKPWLSRASRHRASRSPCLGVGEARLGWFKTFIELSKGIPSHDTFGRLFSLISAKHFIFYLKILKNPAKKMTRTSVDGSFPSWK